jgi:hypothetical protein
MQFHSHTYTEDNTEYRGPVRRTWTVAAFLVLEKVRPWQFLWLLPPDSSNDRATLVVRRLQPSLPAQCGLE